MGCSSSNETTADATAIYVMVMSHHIYLTYTKNRAAKRLETTGARCHNTNVSICNQISLPWFPGRCLRKEGVETDTDSFLYIANYSKLIDSFATEFFLVIACILTMGSILLLAAYAHVFQRTCSFINVELSSLNGRCS